MTWFHRLFPCLMILFPAVLVACIRSHPRLGRPEAARHLQRRLWGATAALLVAFAVARILVETGMLAESAEAPLSQVFGMGGFFLLHFRYAQPALQARSPGWGGPFGNARRRSASLTDRRAASPIPRGAWILGWLLTLLSAGLGLWILAGPTLRAAGLLPGMGILFWLGFGLWGVRATLQEPEPAVKADDGELQRAHDALRRLRCWAFYGMGLTSLLVFSAASSTVLWMPAAQAERALGWAGPGGGVLLGLAGAAFGVSNSVARARVNNRVRELSEAGSS